MSRHFGGSVPARRNSDSIRYVIIVSAFLLVVCGFVAIVFLSSGQSTANQPTTVVIHEPQIEMTEVIVPVQKIEQGSALEPSMFRRERRQKVGLSAGIVTNFDEVQGQYAAALILPDQPLHKEYTTKTRPINQITEKIPDGYRAVTIRVDARSAVEGWVVPGAHVDVVWATQIAGTQGIAVIVENALVLSADKVPEANQQKSGAPVPSTVTLQVTSEDAKKIQLASISGTLSLSLRGDRDTGRATEGGPITIADLTRGKGIAEAPKMNCQGKVKTCTKDGACEELCLTSDGKLAPMGE